MAESLKEQHKKVTLMLTRLKNDLKEKVSTYKPVDKDDYKFMLDQLDKETYKKLSSRKRDQLGIRNIGHLLLGDRRQTGDLILALDKRQKELEKQMGSKRIRSKLGINRDNPDYVREFDPKYVKDEAEIESSYDSAVADEELNYTNKEFFKNKRVNNAIGIKEEAKVPNKKAKKDKDPADLKTDVFTMDPRTGKSVGVLTRNQRKAFEKALKINEQKPKRAPGLYLTRT